MIGRGTGPVALVAHLPYYRHAAEALFAAGLLDTSFCPPMRTRPLPGGHLPYLGKGVRYFNATRVTPGIDALPTTQLWAAQAGALAVQRSALGLHLGTALPVRARLWDAAVTARLGHPRVVHAVSELAGWCTDVGRRRGAFVVCDVRSAHPRAQLAAVSPFLAARGLPYRLPEAGLVDRLERAFASADLLVCNSDYTRRTYLEQGLPEERVVTVRLGCDPDVFARADQPPERFTVLFIGRERHAKGALELADAARALPADSRLWLSGHPDPVTEQALAGVRAEVRFLGPVPANRMPGLYREASVLALPSYSEGFGMVVLEAMASGLPVVVSDRVGAASLVRDGAAGRVVPAGDVEALTDALVSLEADPDERARVGAAGRLVAEARRWTDYGDDLVAMYREVVLPQLTPSS